ncbi:MAG: AAA family ATPase [Phycisphaerae bacterium]|jgi:predicted ATP-dependent endonuclease of OLD family
MKLKRFKINGVKSIIDSGNCYLSDDNITIFAGQNEAGKTAILQALNYFSNGMTPEFKKYSLRSDMPPRVECEFELSKSDIGTICEKDVRFRAVTNDLKNFVFFRDAESKGFIFDNGLHLNVIDLLKKDSSTKKDVAKLVIEKNPNGTDEEKENAFNKQVDVLAKTFVTTVISLIPEFIYYDTFKDILPDSIQVGSISNNQAVKDLEKILGISFATVVNLDKLQRKNRLDSAFASLAINFNEYWSQQLTDEQDTSYKFQWTIDGTEIQFFINRNVGESLYLAQKSQGFKWFNSFYLRLKSHHLENKKNNCILLIDEPGQGLHETAQMDVKRVIEDLVSQGMQIIYSTHHSLLIDVDDKISRLRLVYHDKKGSKIGTISQFASGKRQALETLSPIVTAMGLVRVDFCNGKLNVVLEGITDKFYIEAFKILLGNKKEYNFIPAAGADNIKHVVSILLGWGHDFRVMHDKKQNVYNKLKTTFFPYLKPEEIDEKILQLEQNGIEDLFTNKDFLKHVLAKTDIPNIDEKLTNSENAKLLGKKELLARLFLEQVKQPATTITKATLQNETIQNFQKFFNWLDSKSIVV